MKRWWAQLEPRDRQAYIRAGLLVAIPTFGIPWLAALLGLGLAIFRTLGGM